MRARADSGRAAPSRAEDRDRGRMRAARTALSFAVPPRFAPSPSVYRPLPYTGSAYALAPSESERNGRREGERGRQAPYHRVAELDNSGLRPRANAPSSTHPFLLTRRWAYASGELFRPFFQIRFFTAADELAIFAFYAQSEMLFFVIISESVGVPR